MNHPRTSKSRDERAWLFELRFKISHIVLTIFMAATSGSLDAVAQTEPDADSSLFQAAVRTTEPLDPEQQQATFQLPDGFQISCFASEPDLQKPMNMAFDADGRLWVTGSNQYPIPAAEGEGNDTLRILEDTNGDGQADLVRVFADDLNIPIGLLPYGNGAIVFSIPDIVYLEDTDADGVADKRTKLYGPFDTSRDTHGMTNSFTAYHDGWIYACHGFNNQSTVSGSDGHAITMISGNTYRFRPDGSRIEIVTRGQVNPFGMTFDDFGDLYTSDCHSKPVNLLIRGGYHESFGKPHDGLGFIPDVMKHQHGSTAIDAVCWYDGMEFPEAFQANLFLGNVMTGRVHRNRIVREGASVSMRQEDDLLVSSDPWFRPVDIQCGPDGCLYIADFYNRIIGHYEVPLDHPGRDRQRGRIWKVQYVGDSPRSEARQTRLKLSTASVEELVGQLRDSRLQVRSKAADLLVTAHGKAAESSVRNEWNQINRNSQSNSVEHLLWILHRLGTLQANDLQQALSNDNPVVRIHAMKVCAERPYSDSLAATIKSGLRDSDRLVQRAAANAAAQHSSVVLFKELVNSLVVCPVQDLHLQHSVKIALRNQLRNDEVIDWFLKDTQPATAYKACSQVISGLKTARTAQLVLAVLQNCPLPQSEITSLIGHAATYANTTDANQLVQLANILPTADVEQLVEIRDVLAEAFDRNPDADLTEFQAFEAKLLNELVKTLNLSKLNWGRYQWDDRPAGRWGLEDREKSSSSVNRFLSSLPGGESAVGVLRSKTFVVPFNLSVELTGHSGSPDKPASLDNQLILRETKSGRILRTHLPPRRDQAIKVSWKLADVVGKRAVLELHDGIDNPAYAWLAIGSIAPSVASLSNGQQSEQQDQLRTVVQILEARAKNAILQKEHLQLLAEAVREDQVDGTTRQMAAAILFRQRRLNSLAPLSALLKFGRVAVPVHNQIAAACAIDEPWISRVRRTVGASESSEVFFDPLPTAATSDEITEIETEKSVPLMDRSAWILQTLQSVCGELPEFYRVRLARKMAATQESAELLMEAIQTGRPSTSVLRDQTVVNLMKSHGQPLSGQVDDLIAALPDEEPVPMDYIQAVLNSTKAKFNSDRTLEDGNSAVSAAAEAGRVVFERHCVVCHRRDNKGGLAGPQLDGIGTRGAERLLEDILYPHRNVDVAFRTSVIVLNSGKSISGLVRPQDDQEKLIVVSADGKTQELNVEDIDEQIPTAQSLMPSGFHKLLSVEEMSNLLRWLCK